jgi:hypothetical protein
MEYMYAKSGLFLNKYPVRGERLRFPAQIRPAYFE